MAKSPISRSDDYDKAPGPVAQRKCQDIFWLILFVLFWVGMFAIGGIGITKGDANRLQYGVDTEGNWCGVNNVLAPVRDNTNASQLYFFISPTSANASSLSDVYQRCIPECPTAFAKLCSYGIDADTISDSEFGERVVNGTCVVTLPSRSVFNRCIPEAFFNATDDVFANSTLKNLISGGLNARDTASKVFQDVTSSYIWILVCAGFAFVLSSLWLIFIQFFSGPTLWFTLIMSIVATGAAAGYCLYNYYLVYEKGEQMIASGFSAIDSAVANEKVLLGVGITAAVLFLIILILAIALRNRIKLAIEIIKEASRSMRALPSLVLLPVLKVIAVVGLFAWVIYIWAMLSTAGEASLSPYAGKFSEATARAGFAKTFEPNTLLRGFQIYYLFGLLWTYNFILAIGHTSAAGAVASYYWTHDKRAIPTGTVLKSIGRCFRYHLGSLALGSFLLGLVQFIRFLVAYAQSQARKSKNKVAQYLLACMQCCLGCVEWIVKLINANAYIEIAIYGHSFCTSARRAFELLTRNAIRLVVVDKVGDFFIFLGKMFITASCGALGLYLISKDSQTAVSFYSIPVIIIALLAYCISGLFLGILETAIDTIFLSFCEDCERNDGSSSKPYYMTDSLKQFTDKHKFDQPSL